MAKPYGQIDPQIVGAWLTATETAPGTMRNYELGLRSWCEYVDGQGWDFDKLEASNVREFKNHLASERNISSRTVSLYISGVKSFYRYAEESGLKNIAANIKGGKRQIGHAREALTREQAKALLASFEDAADELAARDRAVVATLLYTGMRAIEVSRARIGDYSHVGDTRVIRVWGKGRQEADEIVIVVEPLARIIEMYLGFRANLSPTAPLFASCSTSNKGCPISVRTVSKIGKSSLARIGINDPRYTTHSLRHTAVTLALRGGARLEEAQAMARHADLATTMIYAHHIDRLENPAENAIANMLG